MTVARLRFGDYGNGVIGVKTSLPSFDVTVLEDDYDVNKRSFNSEWVNLCKLRMIGLVQSEWSMTQWQGYETEWIGDKQYGRFTTHSGWMQATPVGVPHGLTYIPIWEERVYEPTQGLFFDDFLYAGGSDSNQYKSISGARSCHSGPTTLPANTLWFMPYQGISGYDIVYNKNVSAWKWIADPGPPPPIPPYPAYPPMPTYKPSLTYVVYSNEMGSVS